MVQKAYSSKCYVKKIQINIEKYTFKLLYVEKSCLGFFFKFIKGEFTKNVKTRLALSQT